MAYEYDKRLFVKKGGELHETTDISIAAGATLNKAKQIFEKQNGQWMEVWAGNLDIEPGTIVMFEGTEAEIPSGWAVCDGDNGTPNLIDRFIMGSNVIGNQGDGQHGHNMTSEAPHTHSLVSVTHRHSRRTGYGNYHSTSEGRYPVYAGDHTHNSGSTTHNHSGLAAGEAEPPYYSLAFIMKL